METSRTSSAPGPSGLTSVRYLARLFRDPLRGYADLRRDYGDSVRVPFTPSRAFHLLSRPEHAEHVLVAHQDRYVKAFTYRPLKAFLGDGLLTSEGDTWQRHRRLVGPILSHRHIQGFAPAIVTATRERAATWESGGSLDLPTEMHTLTMDIVGRVLFGTDLASDAEPVARAVSALQDSVMVAAMVPSGNPQRTRRLASVLVPGMRRSAAILDSLVDRIIDERIATPHTEAADLLDRLVAAGAGSDPFSRTEIKDEVMTLVLAGHETTANALTWAFALLSKYPAARQRLIAEVDHVLDGRPAIADDLDALVYTRAVLAEAMRLYPPAWTIERDAVVDDEVAGHPVPKGDTVILSPYLLHRDPQFWPNPEGFDPQRFLPEQATDRPRHSFLPFGGGRRICVGAGFAQLEATLVLATLAATHHLDLAPGTTLRAQAGVTIHPRGALPVTVTERAGIRRPVTQPG